MTKQHFEALAKRIKEIESADCRHLAAMAVADVAREFNPRFDKAKFYAACGVI